MDGWKGKWVGLGWLTAFCFLVFLNTLVCLAVCPLFFFGLLYQTTQAIKHIMSWDGKRQFSTCPFVQCLARAVPVNHHVSGDSFPLNFEDLAGGIGIAAVDERLQLTIECSWCFPDQSTLEDHFESLLAPPFKGRHQPWNAANMQKKKRKKPFGGSLPEQPCGLRRLSALKRQPH
ncbi:uncharacterized protein J3D65DRAFT_604001 [Phyllosticta citribraziliensis]|uniref:Uncharacterized protein n=1 Tax=Phyllosticta citribraziliensis TaxID=989973 RepID=A0ABR1LM46_9PEZI